MKYEELNEYCKKVDETNKILYQENEELRKQIKYCNECAEQLGKHIVVEQYLNEIEEYIYSDCEYNDGCDRNICMKCKYSSIHDKRVLQLIKQAKES